MDGGLGTTGAGGGVSTWALSVCAGAIGTGIITGPESAEKMFLPVPAYSTCSLSASLSKCTVGSRPSLVSFSASVGKVFWPFWGLDADLAPVAGRAFEDAACCAAGLG